MTPHSTDLTTLVAENAIRALWARYCRLLDTHRIADVADEIFAADARYNALGLHGRDEIRSGFVHAMRHWSATAHVMGNTEIAVAGDTAQGWCYVTAWHWRDSPDAEHPADWVTVGRIHDRLRLDPQGWRVVERDLEPVGGPVGVGSWPQWIEMPGWEK